MRKTGTRQLRAPLHGFGLYPRFNMLQEGMTESGKDQHFRKINLEG